MAIFARSSNNWILSLKVLLISTGVLSIAVILKLSFPVLLEFTVSELPLIWSFARSWLKPPYLYLVINGIIITIAASSRYQQKVDEQTETVAPVKSLVDERTVFAVTAPVYDAAVVENPVAVRPEFGYDTVMMNNPAVTKPDSEVLELAAVNGEMEARVSEVQTMENASEGDFVISGSTWTPHRRSSTEIQTEKPLVSIRSAHRKYVKASPEAGRTLGVTKPKRHDTLESTWKTITDGRAMPLARHLKKSDTWETHGRHTKVVPKDPSPQKVKKSETFKDHSSNNPPSSLSRSSGSGKLRKEPSLSQDDLNRRVEAFIKKFNEDMRLQRQESLNQYKEMVSRGTH
ncbi:hypothetical protein HHK36_005422 [Tetracentron sinense]|uniref:DUF4408 domain-containing protein n=1 Tax=Tetracentron sinense TaxID=13715 RepID=A0A834ZN80_TETSI|nr:hypothetical protein HHK36_005422 [Tetracentron sinense]